MKKTLMVLSFALCATFAFAQSNRSLERAKMYDQTVSMDNSGLNHAGYSGSIFTKDGDDDELLYCSFGPNSANYTTGTVTGGQINGTNAIAHTQQDYTSMWHRIADTTAATCTAMQSNYPVLFGRSFSSLHGFDSESPMDGLMIMSLQDQIAAWGGYGTTGNFNAYIAFDPVSTVGEPTVRIRFYQYYRCFNNDKCWIDYSVNGTTWSAVEINVRNVDVAGNSSILGWLTHTLPASVGQQQNLYIRLRWSCDNSDGGAYGYYWMLDDVYILPLLDYEVKVQGMNYFEGFYQIMPQGLQVPVVWNVDFKNEGRNNLTNVTGTIYTYPSGQASTALVSRNLGTVNSMTGDVRSIVIDPLGYYDSVGGEDGGWHGFGYLANAIGVGPTAYLPTANTGVNHFFSNLSHDNGALVFDTATFDTLRYEVNFEASSNMFTNGYSVWGRDNGMLRKFSYYTAGMSMEDSRYWTSDPDDCSWNQPGHGNLVSYVTGAQVPVDQYGNPWRILGLEIVPATRNGMRAVGAVLSPYLLRDSTYVGSDGHYRPFLDENPGAGYYTVLNSDILSGDDFTNLEYLERGDYPTIVIPFPNQPELRPQQSYFVGYELVEEADFTVARSTNYYYTLDDSSAVYFRDVQGMESYGHSLPLANTWAAAVIDATTQRVRSFDNGTPMIHMIIGPGFYVPKFAFTFDCEGQEDYGYIQSVDERDVCGLTDSITQGSTATFYIMPYDGYEPDKLYVDGVETEFEARTDADGNKYGVYSFENVDAAHTMRVTFKEAVGFDPVATGVSMKLQPNPATTNVNLTLKGVNGMVNLSLIDMSGRVIRTSQFNAENGTTIDVSSLAKGAYFVRITNNKFSKVEKLIVR